MLKRRVFAKKIVTLHRFFRQHSTPVSKYALIWQATPGTCDGELSTRT